MTKASIKNKDGIIYPKKARAFLGICLILFGVYFSYRIFFWGEVEKQATQTAVNAMGDALIAASGGLVIYNFNSLRFFNKWFLPGALIIMVLFSSVLYGFHILVYNFFHLLSDDFKELFYSVCFQLLDSVAIVVSGSLATMIRYQQFDKRYMQHTMESLELENKKAELKYLKAQMDPHFVFNGLNMIYHQVDEVNTAARESLLQFASVLRYHLQYVSNESIGLDEEVKYLRSYIQFQRKRCADFLDIHERFEVGGTDTRIEPMILLPLVENAFKFCRGEKQKRGSVNLSLVANESSIDFRIVNSYMPLPKSDLEPCNGIGIGNIRRRLSMSYPGRHRLVLSEYKEEKMFICKLEIW